MKPESEEPYPLHRKVPLDLYRDGNAAVFAAFMENSPAQAWIADEDVVLYYMNAAYRRTFGLGDADLYRKPTIFPREFLELYQRNNLQVLRSNTPLQTIEDGYDPDGGYRVFKVIKFPLGTHGGKRLLGGWMIDLSHELLAEKKLLDVQEEERNAIGRELHDNVNQLLAAAKLIVETALTTPEKAGMLLRRGAQIIQSALDENRALSHRLITPQLAVADFLREVHALASTLNLSGQIAVALALPSEAQLAHSTREQRLALFRIIQEQIGNILKHARATSVSIALTGDEEGWKLSIQDNGVGFDPAVQANGVGLRNIRSRVDGIGGQIELRSAPGQGCQLQVQLPAQGDPVPHT